MAVVDRFNALLKNCGQENLPQVNRSQLVCIATSLVEINKRDEYLNYLDKNNIFLDENDLLQDDVTKQIVSAIDKNRLQEIVNDSLQRRGVLLYLSRNILHFGTLNEELVEDDKELVVETQQIPLSEVLLGIVPLSDLDKFTLSQT